MIHRRRMTLACACFVGLVACDTTPTGSGSVADPYEIGRAKVAECAAVKCTTLDLDQTDLEDYSVLNDLPHVTALMLSYSAFSDLDAISGMTQLKELHMSYTPVNDLSGLAAFPGLTLLHAQFLSEAVDHSPVAGLRRLDELAIGDYAFEQVAVVRELPQLRRLLLQVADNTDLSPLRGQPTLEAVDLGYSFLSDISVMTTLPRLSAFSVPTDGPASNVAEISAILTARGVTVEQREVVPVC